MVNKEYILDINNLSRSYVTITPKGETISNHVLRGISFQVKNGEFVAIMGSSGCGKTTLLKTLGMLNPPDGGEVLYKGENVRKIYGDRLAKLRRKEIAFVFQDYYLLDSLTVQENIMLPLILNGDNHKKSILKVRGTAKRFGIEHLIDKKPYELSGGEKQRTAICRAMAADPELILADEPTGNLDSKASMTVIKTLSYINKECGKTILLVTHDPKVASYSDKILLLKDGKVLDTIVKNEKRGEFYREILRQMERL